MFYYITFALWKSNGESRADTKCLFCSNVDCDGARIAFLAKWDQALSDDEIAGLAKGISPGCYPGFKVYTPMIRNYQELANDLTVANDGSTVTAHPRLYNCN